MTQHHAAAIAEETGLKTPQVRATIELLDAGSTVPFIARYRKEATGALDEVAITGVRDRLEELRELNDRRETILRTIDEQGKLTDELRAQIQNAATMAELEDLYLPYKPKRRTRADKAREKGLEPLAETLFAQKDGVDPAAEAETFVDAETGVESVEDALAGARDIIAEWVNEDQGARAALRELYSEKAVIRSRVASGKEEEGSKYADYFEWEERAAKAPGHRILAMRRGENEGILYLRMEPPEEAALAILEPMFVQGANPCAEQVREAVRDSYKRLLSASMETELRQATKERADEEAIEVFTKNMRQLLLSPALGRRSVLAIDPGFRTGCKVACLDPQGHLRHHDTIYPHGGAREAAEAAETIRDLCERYDIEAVAVGNGTAGRETEEFVRGLSLPPEIAVVQVDESGASIYSASEAAREEFPDLDLTVRGTVSIGRRLQDPLAELVKIDPKSIGVGQYQHDVDQAALRKALDDVVSSCVNSVGVELNTASRQLLTYVSGLGPGLAGAIVEYRNENGPFASRRELLDVPGLGPKTFEQCAGFLRIREADNPLDASAVHPESYPVVERMAEDLGCTVRDLMEDAELRAKIDLRQYVTETTGMPTLRDIMGELARPGRDPREKFEPFRFAEGIESIEDLERGMRLPGIVTNVVKFGAFVDIGVHRDGLIHVSELADRYVDDPSEIVKLRQKVTVTVLDVDLDRQRISLSLRKAARQKD
ncbi:MAG: Tex family protein [Candidatus Brocadiia bacterium]